MEHMLLNHQGLLLLQVNEFNVLVVNLPYSAVFVITLV
jgi:hypothetical protein